MRARPSFKAPRRVSSTAFVPSLVEALPAILGCSYSYHSFPLRTIQAMHPIHLDSYLAHPRTHRPVGNVLKRRTFKAFDIHIYQRLTQARLKVTPENHILIQFSPKIMDGRRHHRDYIGKPPVRATCSYPVIQAAALWAPNEDIMRRPLEPMGK